MPLPAPVITATAPCNVPIRYLLSCVKLGLEFGWCFQKRILTSVSINRIYMCLIPVELPSKGGRKLILAMALPPHTALHSTNLIIPTRLTLLVGRRSHLMISTIRLVMRSKLKGSRDFVEQRIHFNSTLWH